MGSPIHADVRNALSVFAETFHLKSHKTQRPVWDHSFEKYHASGIEKINNTDFTSGRHSRGA